MFARKPSVFGASAAYCKVIGPPKSAASPFTNPVGMTVVNPPSRPATLPAGAAVVLVELELPPQPATAGVSASASGSVGAPPPRSRRGG
jgi:hypothetical protein